MKTKFTLIIFCIFYSAVAFSQDEPIIVQSENESVAIDVIKPKHTLNVVLGLPNTTINKPYESIMKGVVDANVYYQYHLPFALVVGGGFRFIHYKINEFKVPEKLDGVMHAFGPFFKIGYEKFYTKRFAFDASIKIGYEWNFVVTDLNKTRRGGAYQFDAGFVEPTIGFILSAANQSSFRLTIGYTIQGYSFKPSMLGTYLQGGWEQKEFTKTAQFITFGLGYTYYIGKKKD
jgi:hypothetical protein